MYIYIYLYIYIHTHPGREIKRKNRNLETQKRIQNQVRSSQGLDAPIPKYIKNATHDENNNYSTIGNADYC